MMDLPNVALSIQQPWAWMIVSGHKDVENRTWRRNFRGPVLIHAGKKHDVGAVPPNGLNWPQPAMLEMPEEFGGIIGVAEVVDCVDHHRSPWFVGPYAFVLKNARRLPFMPMRGMLGFFPAKYEAPR